MHDVASTCPAPAYSEQEVKATLDSYRLTYIYEPDWTRLRTRVSHILSGGMLVGWFQGGRRFGSGVAAGRAILCDPSNRWARENVNRFLRQVPIETALPLLTLDGPAAWHDGRARRVGIERVSVASESRKQLQGAIDVHGCVEVQGIGASDDSQLLELIRAHQARTEVPALVAVPFCGPSEPVVASPRDAIRTMFSSPIDVLIIERFALAKDHWLLGAQTSSTVDGSR
jgi:carbamoyltransferase